MRKELKDGMTISISKVAPEEEGKLHLSVAAQKDDRHYSGTATLRQPLPARNQLTPAHITIVGAGPIIWTEAETAIKREVMEYLWVQGMI